MKKFLFFIMAFFGLCILSACHKETSETNEVITKNLSESDTQYLQLKEKCFAEKPDFEACEAMVGDLDHDGTDINRKALKLLCDQGNSTYCFQYAEYVARSQEVEFQKEIAEFALKANKDKNLLEYLVIMHEVRGNYKKALEIMRQQKKLGIKNDKYIESEYKWGEKRLAVDLASKECDQDISACAYFFNLMYNDDHFSKIQSKMLKQCHSKRYTQNINACFIVNINF